MPARIEHARAVRPDACQSRLEFFEFAKGLLQIFVGTKNSNQALHRLLQVAMNFVRKFAVRALKWNEHSPLCFFQLG